MSGHRHSEVIGFGFQPAVSKHHFSVVIPRGTRQNVGIWEHFTFDPGEGNAPPSGLGSAELRPRVFLKRSKWAAIAAVLRVDFNRRLRDEGLPTSRWKQSTNRVDRLLGKELSVLAWGIEDAPPHAVPMAIRNWHGLSPEERWWLFTMTCAATGHAVDNRGQGWRKALRFALTENPVVRTDDEISDRRPPMSTNSRARTTQSLSLFGP